MQIVNNINETRTIVHKWRQAGLSIAFVPTMGNLHAGHLKLLTTAKQQADKVIVSIFVNPAQFGPNEDYNDYPRTETADQEALHQYDTDLLFLPAVTEMYPQPPQTIISATRLSTLLCGSSRPGHFDGVALVVCKFLNIVQPDVLLLGEKDFQQLTIISCLVTDLNIPVKIQAVATVREVDGLAMSSRNHYLSASQRQVAPCLYQALCAAREKILTGLHHYQQVLDEQTQSLQKSGFILDYFSLCRSGDLLPADETDTDVVLLIAAKIGKTRLIDNIRFCKPIFNQI